MDNGRREGGVQSSRSRQSVSKAPGREGGKEPLGVTNEPNETCQLGLSSERWQGILEGQRRRQYSERKSSPMSGQSCEDRRTQ